MQNDSLRVGSAQYETLKNVVDADKKVRTRSVISRSGPIRLHLLWIYSAESGAGSMTHSQWHRMYIACTLHPQRRAFKVLLLTRVCQ